MLMTYGLGFPTRDIFAPPFGPGHLMNPTLVPC
jgi:hypothetical protein